jgi:hypothetical protein
MRERPRSVPSFASKLPPLSASMSEASVWLLPRRTEAKPFQRLIDVFSGMAEGPSFAAHLTLWTGAVPASRSAARVLSRVACGEREIVLRLSEIAHSPERFRALFFPVHDGVRLVALRRRLCRAFGPCEFAITPPHISLVYGGLSAAVREQMAAYARSRQAPSCLRFDRLALVGPASGDWNDVAKWRTIVEVRVSGQNSRCVIVGR